MPDDTRVRPNAHVPRVTLNTDGKQHPLENSLTVFTLAAGLLSFALGFVVRAHLAATVLGMAAFGIGLYAQFISATRAERMLIVVGVTAAFVGLGMGIAHGGFDT
ncbi:MAG: hypothetical protein ACM3ML_22635 [Micromonosporaceae bacterium]